MQAQNKRRLLYAGLLLGLLLLTVGSLHILLHDGGESLLRRSLQATHLPLTFKPKPFGAFHIISFAACLGLALLGILAAWRIPADCRERTVDGMVFAAGLCFALLELYKQLYYFFILGNGSYDYTVFPFQFCSLPLYICLFSPLLPQGRAKQAFYAFLSLFGIVGGYLVIGYPRFYADVALSVHTMVWHTVMIALGCFLLTATACGKCFGRDYLPAAGIFLCSFGIATALNIWLYPMAEQAVGTLNLFYMSPYHSTYFMVISDVQQAYGWGASVVTYLLLFLIVGAFPLWLLGRLLWKIRKKAPKNAKK